MGRTNDSPQLQSLASLHQSSTRLTRQQSNAPRSDIDRTYLVRNQFGSQSPKYESINYRRLGRSRLVSHSSPDSSSLQLPGAPVHTRSVTTGGITANADARSSTKLEAEARADARTKENTQQSVQMAATRVASGQVLAEWCSNPTKHHITLPFYMHTFNFQGHKQKHILVFCIVTHERVVSLP